MFEGINDEMEGFMLKFAIKQNDIFIIQELSFRHM